MADLAVAERHDRLSEQHEAVVLKGVVDLPHPAQLAVMAGQLGVVGAVYVHPVAPGVFGHITGAVGSAQHLTDIADRRVAADRHQTDADPDSKALVVPAEAKFLHRAAQGVSDAQRLRLRAVFQQHREFVAAQPAEAVLAA